MPFFIDPGVGNTVNAGAPSVYNGEPNNVFADIEVGDLSLAGVPVEFVLEGPGSLSSTTGGTDETGRARVIYVAPAEGTGTATVTASVTINGQTVTDSATIQVKEEDHLFVKVVPVSGTWNLYNHTVVWVSEVEKSCREGGAQFTWMGGATQCLAAPSGTERETPVTLKAQIPLASIEVKAHEPSPNVFAVDATADQKSGSVLGFEVTTAMTFARKGRLKLEIHRDWGTENSGIALIYPDGNPDRKLVLHNPDSFPACRNSDVTTPTGEWGIDAPGTKTLTFRLHTGMCWDPEWRYPMSGNGRLFTATFIPDP